jgi:hypothetical protein
LGCFKNSYGDAGISSQLQKVDNLGDENYLSTLNCQLLVGAVNAASHYFNAFRVSLIIVLKEMSGCAT